MSRAGTVRARLHRPRVTICALLSPNCLPMVEANGAKLNHTTKVRKNANQVRCSVRCAGPRRNICRTRAVARAGPERSTGGDGVGGMAFGVVMGGTVAGAV